MIDLKISIPIPFEINVLNSQREWYEFQQPIQEALTSKTFTDFTKGYVWLTKVEFKESDFVYQVYARIRDNKFEFVVFEDEK